MTAQLADLTPGAALTLDGPLAAIIDHGLGTFIGAGAGVPPFIPILRGEWGAMQGLTTEFVLTDEKGEGLHHGKMDMDCLRPQINDFGQTFHRCGPGGFVDDMRDALKVLDAKECSIVTAEGW